MVAFAEWLADTQAAIRGERDAAVPCGSCTACCTSSQFVHVGPDEADALAHIPSDVLFAAPGFPPGYVLMGYDERGACPMFVDGRCSIYEHRPRACRTYDCRVFAAASIEPDAPAVAAQVLTWEFDVTTADDASALAAVRAAAAQTTGANATERAVRAVMTAAVDR